MKKGLKAKWTAKESVHQIGGVVEVQIEITIHNLAELGFKEALRHGGDQVAHPTLHFPKERYLTMSPEDKHTACEQAIQATLRELTEVMRGQREVEEIKNMISQEVVTGEMPVQVQEKPLRIPDREEVQRIVREVYRSPRMQKMLPLRELLTFAGNYGLDEKWVSTTGYLLIEEIALKQWLHQHKHSKQELRNKKYHQLLEMLEEDFEEMDKLISPRDIGKFVGDRWFRNRVLHEGYNPTSDETKDTRKMAIGLLEFLKRH